MHWLLASMALVVELLLGAESPSLSDSRYCVVELEALRFVSSPRGDRLPLYWDLKLAAHLTQAFRRTPTQDTALAR
jgi:hypothetical protein